MIQCQEELRARERDRELGVSTQQVVNTVLCTCKKSVQHDAVVRERREEGTEQHMAGERRYVASLHLHYIYIICGGVDY